eukprot:scpid102415/ scgid18654/ NADH dehydrogenase [ubiquinone] iron-sulfur protein 4, mitochondrial; Complex I-18 kDa; Complex I-AQDQ; NADH-ubiquinone oxidoreductase 18 kDa subunit; NADH dehydrogenase [ubiquinone] iron-sulfur protein 4, mitochondrial; Complex I-18 kDa; NADH-ubiquinone oxidoreductase 18 kDa subunit
MLRRAISSATTLCRPLFVPRAASYGNTALQAQGVETNVEVPAVPPEDVALVNGVPRHYMVRTVRIFSPCKNAMQSGTYGTHHWRIEWPNEERWENPLMGWCSSADMHSNLCVEFDTKQQAIDYCIRQGYQYEVDERQAATKRPKSYAANFHYSRRTRIGNK